ncbi:hypothetical protein FA15DRAFT_671971 [Coprinopsis marcescibilis]|uniref:Uncharacterized protein n=1 Tax=Coprinopsis marcescibilis TaxID=230819 RepID=A0A5C3KPF9_COPMA|nr:hypothetical protein FA15DRAFT_671971 [Coprinopsis marcescibilis]
MSSSDHLNITFDYLADEGLYKKAYCVRPPDVGCPFGLCPNPDVTGKGNQFSLFITSTLYCIVLLYLPRLRVSMFYAHFGMIYALLLATVISVTRGDLTRSDAIFVIIAVASPASILLWTYSALSLWRGSEWFQMRLSEKAEKTTHLTPFQNTQIRIFSMIALGSLVFEAAMAGVLFGNIDRLKFSQPGCEQQFGTKIWHRLVWVYPIAAQLAVGAFLVFAAGFLFRNICVRRLPWRNLPHAQATMPTVNDTVHASPDETNGSTDVVDIITWTESILKSIIPEFSNSKFRICIITVVQFAGLPTVLTWPIGSNQVSAIILAVGIISDLHEMLRRRLSERREPVDSTPGMGPRFIISSFSILSIACVSSYFMPFVTTAMVVHGYLMGAVCLWTTHYLSSTHVRVKILNTMFYFLYLAGLPTGLGPWTSLQVLANARLVGTEIEATVSTGPLASWIIVWLGTTIWTWDSHCKPRKLVFKRSWETIKTGVLKRAHILRFSAFIITPHVLWIQATHAASPSSSNEIQFGQLFAIIATAIFAVNVLLEALRTLKRDTVMAFFLSEPMPLELQVTSAGQDVEGAEPAVGQVPTRRMESIGVQVHAKGPSLGEANDPEVDERERDAQGS